MAIVFLQYSYVCTNAPNPFCIPEEIPSRIFTWVFSGRLVDHCATCSPVHLQWRFDNSVIDLLTCFVLNFVLKKGTGWWSRNRSGRLFFKCSVTCRRGNERQAVGQVSTGRWPSDPLGAVRNFWAEEFISCRASLSESVFATFSSTEWPSLGLFNTCNEWMKNFEIFYKKKNI